MLAAMAASREIRQAVGERIAQARRPESQDWLAGQLGVKQGAVSRWERGEVLPLDRLPDIEIALELPPGTLTSMVYGAAAPVLTDRSAETGEALDAIVAIRRQLDQVEQVLRQR